MESYIYSILDDAIHGIVRESSEKFHTSLELTEGDEIILYEKAHDLAMTIGEILRRG